MDDKKHNLEVTGLGIKKAIKLSVDDLKKRYEPVKITSAIQWFFFKLKSYNIINFSAGNRRNDMNKFKKVQGLMWTGSAISNAEWTGCRLRVCFRYFLDSILYF